MSQTTTRFRFPTATLLMLLAAVVVILLALTLQKSGPQDLGGTRLQASSNSQGAGNGNKPCPPKSVYGVGQPADKGCGNRPPPGQAKKNP